MATLGQRGLCFVPFGEGNNVDGPKRFNELRRLIPGISQRTLTLDLRMLEDADLVQRTVYPTVPVKVDYALTEHGKRLEKVVNVVQEFELWLKARGPIDV